MVTELPQADRPEVVLPAPPEAAQRALELGVTADR